MVGNNISILKLSELKECGGVYTLNPIATAQWSRKIITNVKMRI